MSERLLALFRENMAAGLVASAACGADLIALEAAGALGLRRIAVLPFARERFRETSVVDRPGDWGPLYDHITEELGRSGDLLVLREPSEGNDAYLAANEAILQRALEAGGESVPPAGVVAVLVWDGRPRGEDDMTARFGVRARALGLPVLEVSTL